MSDRQAIVIAGKVSFVLKVLEQSAKRHSLVMEWISEQGKTAGRKVSGDSNG